MKCGAAKTAGRTSADLAEIICHLCVSFADAIIALASSCSDQVQQLGSRAVGCCHQLLLQGRAADAVQASAHMVRADLTAAGIMRDVGYHHQLLLQEHADHTAPAVATVFSSLQQADSAMATAHMPAQSPRSCHAKPADCDSPAELEEEAVRP